MKERNYGIDFLRILSMFMVVTLHVLGQGGILKNAVGINYWVAWLMEITCFCAVNCFAIISGYVMCGSSVKYSRLIELWFQTVFYSVSITAIYFILRPDAITLKTTLRAIFPVSHKHYWYISAYFGLYLLIPLVNAAIKNIRRKTLEFFLIATFIIMIILPTALGGDPYILNGGYSVIWLLLLYILGAYIKMYDITSLVKRRTALITFVGCVFVTIFSKFILEKIGGSINKLITPSFLINYTSPTIILTGISLFIFFAKTKFPTKINKLISVLAPASLGVYIIHNCAPIWSYFIKDFSKGFVKYNFLVLPILVIASALAIYIICSIIDLARIYIFKKLKVYDFCVKLETKLTKKFN